MKRCVWFLIVFCCMIVTLHAQEAKDVKAEINRIKLDTTYVSAEATDLNRDSARCAALCFLAGQLSVKGIVRDVPTLDRLALSKEVKRGESIRVFVYVKVSDLDGKAASIQSPVAKVQKPAPPKKPLPAVVTSLMNLGNDVRTLSHALYEMKQRQEMNSMGTCREGAFPKDAYIVVFGRDKMIKAFLSPMNDGKRSNLQTGVEDAPQRYSGCGAIWFKTE